MGSNNNAGAAAGGGAIYGLGIFGAVVYFWQQADSFWEYLGAIFQGPVLAGVHGLRGLRVPGGLKAREDRTVTGRRRREPVERTARGRGRPAQACMERTNMGRTTLGAPDTIQCPQARHMEGG